MIGLIGIKKNTPIEVREKLSLHQKNIELYSIASLKIVKEVLILSTCNRTEIYFNDFSHEKCEEEILKKIFEILNWDYSLRAYVFFTRNYEASKHLFEVCCGFHSKIMGEDQILGQVKNSYEYALENNFVNGILQRLFQEAITCGKKFRDSAKLFQVPVSSSSIVVNESIKKGCSRFMVMGYGEIGKSVVKYLLSNSVEIIYLVVRNEMIKNEINDRRVNVISFSEKNRYIDEVHCIIGCTSAPHAVLKYNEVKQSGQRLIIYDLAVPRDIEESIDVMERVEMYNIDTISFIDDENKTIRKNRMDRNRYLIDKYLDKYWEWVKLRKISSNIKSLKNIGEEVYKKRMNTFNNKSKNKEDINLANMLIKSTSDFYINRAIKVLKEETLKGCDEECLKIIKKIFKA